MTIHNPAPSEGAATHADLHVVATLTCQRRVWLFLPRPKPREAYRQRGRLDAIAGLLPLDDHPHYLEGYRSAEAIIPDLTCSPERVRSKRQAGFAQIGLLLILIFVLRAFDFAESFKHEIISSMGGRLPSAAHGILVNNCDSKLKSPNSCQTLNKTVVEIKSPKPEKENVWSKAIVGAFGLLLIYALCTYFSVINKEFDNSQSDKGDSHNDP